MTDRLLILACSKTKAFTETGKRVPFAQLYDGPTWRQAKAAGFPVDRMAAVSALHGLLLPGQEIATYDVQMTEERSRFFCETSNDVHRLAELIEHSEGALFVGGALYQELGRAALRYRPRISYLLKCAAGSFLQQRRQLSEWLRA